MRVRRLAGRELRLGGSSAAVATIEELQSNYYSIVLSDLISTSARSRSRNRRRHRQTLLDPPSPRDILQRSRRSTKRVRTVGRRQIPRAVAVREDLLHSRQRRVPCRIPHRWRPTHFIVLDDAARARIRACRFGLYL